ncbi:MAG: cysteine desulfurase, partial [Pseudomonadota bacterium]
MPDGAQSLALDVASLREEFPILKREAYGKPLVYLDNAASAQKPRAVIDAMKNAMHIRIGMLHRVFHR